MNFIILSEFCSSEVLIENVTAQQDMCDGEMISAQFNECDGDTFCDPKKFLEKNRIQLMDLNSDCLCIILEQLDIQALSDMALTNKHFHYWANIVFQRKFSNRRVVVGSRSIEKLFDSRDDFIVVNTNFTGSFLKAFANSIKRLTIASSFLTTKRDESIATLINEHCSQTLEDFRLEGDIFLLKDIHRPYENVKSATFQSSGLVRGATVKLNKLFPNLQHLDLHYYSSNPESFECNFPLLMDLHVGSGFYSTFYTRLITENPQVQKIRSSYVDVDFLQNVNQLLPQLHALEIVMGSNHANSSSICFENLKELSIHIDHEKDWFDMVSFKQLESLELVCEIYANDRFIKQSWIDFVASNMDLKKLNVTGVLVDESGLQTLTKPSKLIEVNIVCDRDIREEAIIAFLEANQEIKTFNMKIVHIYPSIHADYIAKFDALSKQLDTDGQTVRFGNHSDLYELKLKRSAKFYH